MKKKVISTPEAPAAVGAYNQGLVVGEFVFTAGQIALIPSEQGQLDNASVETETRRVMQNLTAVLGAAGCKLADVYRVRIYISDRELFPEVNRIYGEYFEEGEEPVRECVVAAPPLEGAHVEMSMDATLPHPAVVPMSDSCD
jgi:2-iminobutanoate/2-iminopropanoate deaminase